MNIINKKHPVTKNYIIEELDKLDINYEESKVAFETKFKEYDDLYKSYYNHKRTDLFKDPKALIDWHHKQNSMCGYCGVSADELETLAIKRAKDFGFKDGRRNLTLNGGKKRSQGNLEIERLNSESNIYSYENTIFACPLCNNAKSNLVDENGWRTHFALPMRNYYQELLGHSLENQLPLNYNK